MRTVESKDEERGKRGLKMKGGVSVFTGEGRGKTAAAMGLALRAVGAGGRIYIARFLKA
jgi:cob(I)alamin adenosyltransferase